MNKEVIVLKELIQNLEGLSNTTYGLSLESKEILLESIRNLYVPLQRDCEHSIEHIQKDFNGDYYCSYCGRGYMSGGIDKVMLRPVPELPYSIKRTFAAIEAYKNARVSDD